PEPDKDGKDKKDKPDGNDKKGGQQPPVTGPVLPPNAEPDPQAKVVTLADGRQVYDRVLVRVADVRVPFRLIIPTAVTRLPAPQVVPFYVMESKVWNGLYRAGGGDVRAESAANGPDAPVTFVTAQEAATFAWGAFGKEFRLPS